MADQIACWSCGEVASTDANWCEACGSSMEPPPDPCVSCDANGDGIQDGYCGTCGHKQPDPRDHIEIDLGRLALVSDKGKRHHLNEDAMAATATNAGIVIVVCDGVSSTVAPETASQAAAESAASALTVSLSDDDQAQAMARATAIAQQAVIDTPATQRAGDPASCTFVAVTVPTGPPSATEWPVTVGWLGDSRAYLFSGDAATQLTTDDSLEHSITRWLGEDATDVAPSTSVIDAASGDTLIVCSDGMWNYAPTEADLAELITQLQTDTPTSTPLQLAQRLVQYALDGGGHDNVTVAVASL